MPTHRTTSIAATATLLLLAGCVHPGAALFGIGDDSDWIRDTTRSITSYSETPMAALSALHHLQGIAAAAALGPCMTCMHDPCWLRFCIVSKEAGRQARCRFQLFKAGLLPVPCHARRRDPADSIRASIRDGGL